MGKGQGSLAHECNEGVALGHGRTLRARVTFPRMHTATVRIQHRHACATFAGRLTNMRIQHRHVCSTFGIGNLRFRGPPGLVKTIQNQGVALVHAMRGSPSCMGKGRLPTNALCGQGSLFHECTQPHCAYGTDMHARHLPAYSRTCAYCTDDTRRLIRAHSGRVRFGHVGVGRRGQAVRTCQCMSPVLNPRVALQKHAGQRC